MRDHLRAMKSKTTDRLHQYCCVRYPVYAAWHEHPFSNHTHWFMLVVFSIGWVTGLSFQLWWFPVLSVRALSWHQTVELDTGTNDESSIAVATNGTIGIAWRDATNKRLRYAYCSSNCASSSANWTIETVDGDSNTSYNAGEYPVLAFNSSSVPGIMYYQRGDTSGLINNDRYAVRDSGNIGCGNQSSTSWRCETVDAGGISGGEGDKYFSLVYSSAGQARATWFSSSLKYGVRVGNDNWSNVSILSTPILWGGYSALMLDVDNNPSIVFSRSGDIKFASCTAPNDCTVNTSWGTLVGDDHVPTIIADTANTLGTALDAKLVNGVYHVATIDSTNYDIVYYTCAANCAEAANWSSAIVVVDVSSYWVPSLSIAVNASGNPRIAYHQAPTNSDGNSNTMNFAKCDGSCTIANNWSKESLPNVNAANDRPGLFIDGSGNANMSFTDSTDDINYVLSSVDTPPSLASLNVTGQATDGTGYVTFSVQVSDINTNDTPKAKIEYSDDGGSNWYDPILVDSVTVSAGSVDMNNGQTYQIGTVNPIDTANGATITLTAVWDTKNAGNGNGAVSTRNTNMQVRVIANDLTFDSTAATSSTFTVDNAVPTGLAGLAKGTPTTTTMPLTWTAASDGGFSKYDIWYGTSQTDVANRSVGAGAAKWSTLNDSMLYSASTTTTTITNLSVNTQYYFKIWAIDDKGNEATIADINGYSGANAPGAPTVNGATGSTLAITIDTNSNPTNVTYAIQEDGSTLYVQANGALGASAVWQTNAVWGTVTVTGLTKNTSYAFGVKAQNGDAVSIGYFSTTAAYTAVDAPTNFRVTTTSSSSLAVAVDSFVNDSVAPAGYRFQITAPITADSGWQRGNNLYTFSALSARVTYTLSVTYRTTGSVEVGPATLQAMTNAIAGSVDSTPPRSVTAFAASAAADGSASILLTWIDPPDSDLLDIIILRSEGTLPVSGNVYDRAIRGARRFVDTKVSAGQKYNYILKAEDNATNFSLSAQQSVTLLMADGQATTTVTEQTVVPPSNDTVTPTVTTPTSTSTSESAPSRAAVSVDIKELIRVQHAEDTSANGEEDECASGAFLCTVNHFFRVQNVSNSGLLFLINTFIPNRQRQEIARTRLLTTSTTKKIVGVFGGLYDLVPQGRVAGESFTPTILITIRYNPRDAAILVQPYQSLALAYFSALKNTWDIISAEENIPEGSWSASVGQAGTYGLVIVE